MTEKTDDDELLLNAAHALSNPVRLAIIRKLAERGACYHGNMAEVLLIAPITLSQHLKVLRDAGMIKGEIAHPRVKYCLNRKNLEKIRDSIDAFLNSALSESDYTY